MTSKNVSALKFVGTVSVGLLTGVSYSLSSLAAPAFLALPSASSASKAFQYLVQFATPQLHTLSILSSSSFALAFVLSPRTQRHPYLLYTSLLTLTSSLGQYIAPLLLGSSSNATTQPRAAAAPKRKPAKSMEASYEVLGDAHSEGTSASAEEVDEEASVNGEGVRGEVEDWLKARLVQTGVAAVGFIMSVVGIWGDGVPHHDIVFA